MPLFQQLLAGTIEFVSRTHVVGVQNDDTLTGRKPQLLGPGCVGTLTGGDTGTETKNGSLEIFKVNFSKELHSIPQMMS